jgi:hypothetical protein
MGRGKSLTEYEKGQIDILESNGKSLREIGIAIGRGENGKMWSEVICRIKVVMARKRVLEGPIRIADGRKGC